MAAPIVCSAMRVFSRSFQHAKIFTKQTSLAPVQNASIRHYMNVRELKRFYKNASIATADGWYEINLDKRKLRTPAGNIFRVPNEALALAVATEWNGQEKLVKRHKMHLTNLCNTAIDNPLQKTRDDLTESIVHFLETETICYRMEEPKELQELQTAEWEPILQWACDRKIESTSRLKEQKLNDKDNGNNNNSVYTDAEKSTWYKISIESTYSIAPPVITEDSKDVIRKHLKAYSDWALVGYDFGVDAIKSLLLMMAVVDRHISVERAIELAALEQIFQCKRWGSVEWYHDMDKYELQSRVAAATLFVHWCSENTSVRQKASLAML